MPSSELELARSAEADVRGALREVGAMAEGRGGLADLLRWIGENPGAWPVPLVGYLVWQQQQLMWALIQRLDALTEAVRALERSVR